MKVTPVNKKFGKYQPGDVFDLPPQTAKVFIKVGKLAEVPALLTPEQGEAAARSHLYSTRMMRSDSGMAKQADPAPYGYKADGTPRKRPGRTKAEE